ncbi:MAG: hypothetical protein JRJ65_20780 [Deltaproteobacteria bacterium]|nr:hypothetical protein [Deltaproteobacteria bacterium]
MILKGKVWKFGDDISTDYMAPSFSMANLKRMGIGCVVAESFARIFFRNCMAIAFPVIICKGVSKAFEEGNIMEIDFENSIVKNQTQGLELEGNPLHPDLLKIVKAGGILESLECK